MNEKYEQIAVLKVLYCERPEVAGEVFVEVRQWETVNGERLELVAEYGRLNEVGELVTVCQVMPFFLSVREVLAVLQPVGA